MNSPFLDFPKISIVTPSLNQGQFLERTIQSVINQNYPNLEYIVIDGGSTDNSVDIIRKHQQNISYWCSEPDKGHYAAVNKGFSKATGDVFAWLNSDDMYCPWALKTVGSIFQSLPEVHWMTTLTPLKWDEQGFCFEADNFPGFSKEAFLNGIYLPWDGTWPIQQESTFWRRSLWESVGGVNLEFQLAGDFDLWCQFLRKTDLYGLRSPLGGFRVHQNQRSHQVDEYREEAHRSLHALRKELSWKEKIQSSRAKNSEPDSRIIRFLNAAWRKLNSRKYIGKNIGRTVNINGSSWRIEEDTFFD